MYFLMYNSIVQAKVPKNHCAIKAKFWKIDFYYIKLIILIIIDIDKQGQNGTTIFNILDNTTELWMTKYIIGEIFSSSGAALHRNPFYQIVARLYIWGEINEFVVYLPESCIFYFGSSHNNFRHAFVIFNHVTKHTKNTKQHINTIIGK